VTEPILIGGVFIEGQALFRLEVLQVLFHLAATLDVGFAVFSPLFHSFFAKVNTLFCISSRYFIVMFNFVFFTPLFLFERPFTDADLMSVFN
jgi:hypothetical protein